MTSATGQRRHGMTGARLVRWVAAVLTLGLLGALVGAQPASAVHDDNLFELGGVQAANILGDGDDANGPDWADIFDASGSPVGLPTYGGVAASFIMDDNSLRGASDRTTFSGAGGSNKNNDPISGPGDTWHWDSGNVPAKDDLTNLYAYAKQNPTSGNLVLYSGFERVDPSGDSHLDIEFFQDDVALDEAVPCNDPGSDATPCAFAGTRTEGDFIVSMDFEVGGTIGTVSVREWDGTQYALVEELTTGEGCNLADTICAFNNGTNIDGGPWPNINRTGNVVTNLERNAFTEFGIDLTALLGGTPCVSTFMGKTRSSSSFTAELKDFGGPTAFDICNAAIQIAPSDVNEVGEPHTFTVSAQQLLGAQSVPVPDGQVIDVTLTGDAVNVDDTCASPGTVNGSCTVTFTSNTPGTVVGHASADITVGNTTKHVETDGVAPNSDNATKRFVDAFITINPPQDTNGIGETHTFTVAVTQDDGTGSGPQSAPDGTLVAVSLIGDADNVVDNCATTGTVSGSCTVTFTSDTEGQVTGHAEVDLVFDNPYNGDVTVHRETDATGSNSGDAVKDFVDGSLRWTKVDNAGALQGGATFEVCRTHYLNTSTEPDTFDDINPDVCVTVADDVDGVAGPGPDQDPDAGEFLLSGLVLGRYTVHETIAPPGYIPSPLTVTVELTLTAPDAVIADAFVNNRPIVKLTEFGYTNTPTGTPTSGVVSGTTAYTVKVKNFGLAPTALTGTLEVSTDAVSGTLSCPASPLALDDDPLDAGEEVTFTLTCTYTNLNDGAEVRADLDANYETNGLLRAISGSPASIIFTVQSD